MVIFNIQIPLKLFFDYASVLWTLVRILDMTDIILEDMSLARCCKITLNFNSSMPNSGRIIDHAQVKIPVTKSR